MYYLQTRYYDPEVGRFITIDDISYLAPDTISGMVSYGIGTMLSSFGGMAGQYISQITIYGKTLSSIVPLDIFISVGSKIFEIGGGFIFGLYFDNTLNEMFYGKGLSLRERIKGSLESGFLEKLINFFAYLWS